MLHRLRLLFSLNVIYVSCGLFGVDNFARTLQVAYQVVDKNPKWYTNSLFMTSEVGMRLSFLDRKLRR
jgi:hypothetical protein